MKEISKISQPTNPLGLMAQFVLLVEAIAGTSLIAAITKDSPYTLYLIIFIMTFPTTLVLFFLMMVVFKREVLYAPGDFRDDKSFIELLNKIKKTEVRVKALSVDVRGTAENVGSIARELLDNGDVDGLAVLARGFLKIKRYDVCVEMLNDMDSYHLKLVYEDDKTKKLFGIALIMRGEIERGVKILGKLHNSDSISSKVALAYASHKLGDEEEYINKIKSIKSDIKYKDNINEIAKYYPEIYGDLVE